MKLVADTTYPRKMHCIIEPERYADSTGTVTFTGFRLYVWENGEGVFDDLQEDLDVTKEVALEMFQVPLTAWRQIG